MAARNHTNAAQPTELTTTIDDGTTDLVLPVVSTAGFPDPPYLVAIDRKTADEEVCLVTADDANSMTVTRGYDGTTGKAHTSAAPVEHVSAAIDYAEANAHINDAGLDHHTQYMATDGTRHDETDRHAVGSVVPVGEVGDIAAEEVGSTAAAGTTTKAADAGHRHAMPSAQAIQSAVVPIGTVQMSLAATAPTGWLICNGAAVSRTTYADLFAVIGTTWGAGDGTTTFNLPDTRGRVPIGVGQGVGLTNRTMGQYIGAETHQLSWDEMPTHTHIQNAHTHTQVAHRHEPSATEYGFVLRKSGSTYIFAEESPGPSDTPIDRAYTDYQTPVINSTTPTNQNSGSDQAHNNMQPSFAVNMIVKV